MPWKKQYNIANYQTTVLGYLRLTEIKTEARHALWYTISPLPLIFTKK